MFGPEIISAYAFLIGKTEFITVTNHHALAMDLIKVVPKTGMAFDTQKIKSQEEGRRGN